MRSLIATSLLLVSLAPAAAAPSSCAGKFIGEWRHTGGNRGSVMADGRALCSEHPACVQGTWTCSGNVFTYTNPVGTWNYTLAPDGRTMSTGSAVSTRLGPVPASARSRDLGAASNVTADVLGIDRTPSAAPRAAAPLAAPPKAAAPPERFDSEKRAAAQEAETLLAAGKAAYGSAGESSYGDRKRALSVAEGNFTNAAEKYRKAGDKVGEAKARRAIAVVRAEDAKTPEHAPRAARPTKQAAGNRPSKEECEQVGIINIAIVHDKDPEHKKRLQMDRDRLKARCK